MLTFFLVLVILLWSPFDRVNSLGLDLRMVISRNSEHDNYVAKWQAKGNDTRTWSLKSITYLFTYVQVIIILVTVI